MRTSDISPDVAVADLEAFLAGRWRLRRRIHDRRSGEHGSFEGTAIFQAEDGGLAYREQGVVKLGGYRGRASQRHHYRFPDPSRAVVSFAHGRFFHDLDLSRGVWTVEHLCGADTYRGRFRVGGPDRWEAFWRVTGPRKDQELASEFLRDA